MSIILSPPLSMSCVRILRFTFSKAFLLLYFFFHMKANSFLLIFVRMSSGIPIDCMVYMNCEIMNVFAIRIFPYILRFLLDHSFMVSFILSVLLSQLTSMFWAWTWLLKWMARILLCFTHLKL